MHLSQETQDPPAAKKAKIEYSEKDKTKEQYVAILHVHPGQKTRAPLPHDLWKKITKLLIVKLEIEEELELEKDFDLDWVDGRGVIRCIKENTVDIFIRIIQDFKIKDQKFRAWRYSTLTNPTLRKLNIMMCCIDKP